MVVAHVQHVSLEEKAMKLIYQQNRNDKKSGTNQKVYLIFIIFSPVFIVNLDLSLIMFLPLSSFYSLSL